MNSPSEPSWPAILSVEILTMRPVCLQLQAHASCQLASDVRERRVELAPLLSGRSSSHDRDELRVRFVLRGWRGSEGGRQQLPAHARARANTMNCVNGPR